jgi:hypothetical protein
MGIVFLHIAEVHIYLLIHENASPRWLHLYPQVNENNCRSFRFIVQFLRVSLYWVLFYRKKLSAVVTSILLSNRELRGAYFCRNRRIERSKYKAQAHTTPMCRIPSKNFIPSKVSQVTNHQKCALNCAKSNSRVKNIIVVVVVQLKLLRVFSDSRGSELGT